MDSYRTIRAIGICQELPVNISNTYQNRWATLHKRVPLNHVVDHLFPGLCALGTKLMEHMNYKSGELVKCIAKIFCAAIRVRYIRLNITA